MSDMEERKTDKARARELVGRIEGLEGLTFTEARGAAMQDIVKCENELIALLEKYGGKLSPMTAQQVADKVCELIDAS